MKLNEFTTTVQTVADIDSKEQAEKAIRAALGNPFGAHYRE